MRTSSRGWPAEVVAMDLLGPLPKTKADNVSLVALVNYISRWAKLTALRKAEISDVVSVLRDV